jgi:predicted metal-binding membrane protein
MILRVLCALTIDSLGFQHFCNGNYRTGLMYLLTFGGLFVMPWIDLVNELIPIPKVMQAKRRILSFMFYLAWSRFMYTMPLRWLAIYLITGEINFGSRRNDLFYLLIIVPLSMFLVGEISISLIENKTVTTIIGSALTLYNVNTNYLTLRVDPAGIISNIYHLVLIVIALFINFNLIYQGLMTPNYLPLLLVFNPDTVPREKWERGDFENSVAIMFMNKSLYLTVPVLYEYLVNSLYAQFS